MTFTPAPSLMVLTSATEAAALANNTTVAVFSDTNLSDTATSFTANIDWGDGVTTAGTVSGSNGSFTVQGGHTYADEGTDAAKVTLTHTSDQATSTVSGNVAVAEGDVLTGRGMTIAAVQGQTFNGTVATFSDTDLTNVAGDFVATINWGDGGGITIGTVTGANGSFTVSASHTYATAGQDTIQVSLTDDAPGSANAIATTTAVVAAGFIATNFGAGDFDTDGDKNGDLLWQNADGSVVTWDMNGAQIGGQTSLGTLPPNWHLAGVGHFNPGTSSNTDAPFHSGAGGVLLDLAGVGTSSNTDALFHSDAGGVLLWEIANNHVGVNQQIGQLPINWHIVGLGDFNGGGASDVLSQSDAGQMLMWEMNATQVILNQVLGQAPTGGHAVAVADFNNDGKADILFQTDSGDVFVWLMNGTQIVTNRMVGHLPLNWHFVATGDFNGDGNADILFRSDAGAVLMWEMNGTQVLVNQVIGQMPTNWHISGTADVNGDGKSDIVFTSDAGAHEVWEMNGTQVIADLAVGPNGTPASPPLIALASASAAASTVGDAPAATGGDSVQLLNHDQHFLV